jgi:SAM-dependent methyltransferase
VWKEAVGKLDNQPAYYFAAQEAAHRAGARILELGSNHWPVIPIGVFPTNPTAEFFTVDCNYQGLWLMEKVVDSQQPDWNRRIHRFLADYTQPLPLPDQSIDLAVSCAAFGPVTLDAESCWAGFLELARVLKPQSRFYCDMATFESRPAWLLWALLQRFRLRDDWNAGRGRTLCLEKRGT